jgi:hypothetical protein
MRSVLASFLTLFIATACGSDGSGGTGGGGGGGQGGETSASGGSGGTASTGQTAQVRFAYQADWKDHLGVCASISDYRIKFGAIPVPITVSIDVTPDSIGDYVELEGRLYKDADVLHIFSCNRSQTSKDTKQAYGRFGTDLSLAPEQRYTVTLGGDAATLTVDP